MKHLFVFTFALLLSLSASSQILNPVKWSYAAKRTSKTEAILYLKATIGDGWHIYSQSIAEGGPLKTSFSFNQAKDYKLIGKTLEPKAITKFEKSFEMNVSYFEKAVVFQQKVKLTGAKVRIKGILEFMVCNEQQCLPPETVEFSIPVS
ncbi:protein-disulfide reductase DsbD N-terminal domain-containing protein [Pedobacter foliorum]|uniref:protein-disulfide reductase DsbD N-terminal domain-containing protein n=1 Tax=Pedobacter foliorum TaxID=2739058 RepID=UPI001566596A|nr:protein-disulfide reductase DsbD N-terminal domain-containing protein [Pedobacter foliorum]NRF37456.1 sugar transporter [Pedobacter foliorum]